MPQEGPNEVRVEVNNGRKAPARSPRSSAFVYVNEGYAGSVNSITDRTVAPITGVYREQYCVCSRWPYTQRILAIAVGVLLGALIGLAISMALRGADEPVLGPIFYNRSSR